MPDTLPITKAKILFVDDEADILSALKRLVRGLNASCLFASNGAEALEVIEQHAIDVVVSDMRMPGMNGAELLAKIAEQHPETIRIVLSGHSDADMVMSAVNEGRIWSYISKPWDDNQLILTLEHAIFTQQIIAERALLRRTLAQYEVNKKEQFEDFIGSSVPMQFIYSAIERAAPSSASVFITGPSGSGKEVAAKAIHNLSTRRDQSFLAINCAAIPHELMESEIFGHIKGAFSGAVNNRDGAATLADGGTLFLDELSEMDIGLQAKLLRFIQTGTFQKVGSSKTEQVDIRFVCATNRDPMAAIADKKLREDLFYRLNVISIDLPALKQRDNDIVLLAQHFLQQFAKQEDKIIVGFSKEAETLITNYDWPGNVRQLQNCIHNTVIMANGPLIDQSDIANALALNDTDIKALNQRQHTTASIDNLNIPNSGQSLENTPLLPEHIVPLSEIEKATIKQAITICGDNVVKAASHLAVSPSTLYRKIQSWNE